MIPTYNCANYLKDTLESVLKQDLGAERMQIEVIDDCSTKDDPEEVVRLYGKGRVKFYKQPQNVGATSNFNTCVDRSDGNLIHILHGDDTVNEGFYTSIEQVFKDNSNVGICFTRSNVIDENGNLDTISPRIIKLETGSNNIDDFFYENPFRTPGVVVRKELYEKFGKFKLDLIHTADWEMWLRLIKNSSGYIINKPLANYRFFALNDTSKLMESGDNLNDYLRLANELSKLDLNFNYLKFKLNILRLADEQTNSYFKKGNTVSYENNRKVYTKIFKSLPFKTRIIISLRSIKNKLIN